MIAILLAAGGFLALGNGRDDSRSNPSLVVARDLRSGYIGKAEWVAMNPHLRPDQIAMVCDIPERAARRYARDLDEVFATATLNDLRADCSP